MTQPESPEPEPLPAAPAGPPPRAAHWAEIAGTRSFGEDFRTPKIRVPRDRWVEAHAALKPHLPFFSWLSAIDWSGEVAFGDPIEGEVEERYEVLSCLADVTTGEFVLISTDLPRDDPRVDSLTGVYGGAGWHEREAADMFGLVFVGHPNLVNIYLPDGFEGHPLRKSYRLLSREVKPWPGAVEVAPLPTAEGAAPPPASPEEGGS